MRAKHQKRACSNPPENPLMPRDRIRLAEPSRCLRHIFGEPESKSAMRIGHPAWASAVRNLQLIISRTQRTTQDATTVVVLVWSCGTSWWIASWYSPRLVAGRSGNFRSSCRAERASIEKRKWGCSRASGGKTRTKRRWLSNLSSLVKVSQRTIHLLDCTLT